MIITKFIYQDVKKIKTIADEAFQHNNVRDLKNEIARIQTLTEAMIDKMPDKIKEMEIKKKQKGGKKNEHK